MLTSLLTALVVTQTYPVLVSRTLTVDGGAYVTGLTSAEVDGVVSVAGPIVDAGTLTVTLAEANPQHCTNPLDGGAVVTSAAINTVTTGLGYALSPIKSSCVLVTWAVQGTSPSFGAVNLTLVNRTAIAPTSDGGGGGSSGDGGVCYFADGGNGVCSEDITMAPGKGVVAEFITADAGTFYTLNVGYGNTTIDQNGNAYFAGGIRINNDFFIAQDGFNNGLFLPPAGATNLLLQGVLTDGGLRFTEGGGFSVGPDGEMYAVPSGSPGYFNIAGGFIADAGNYIPLIAPYTVLGGDGGGKAWYNNSMLQYGLWYPDAGDLPLGASIAWGNIVQDGVNNFGGPRDGGMFFAAYNGEPPGDFFCPFGATGCGSFMTGFDFLGDWTMNGIDAGTIYSSANITGQNIAALFQVQAQSLEASSQTESPTYCAAGFANCATPGPAWVFPDVCADGICLSDAGSSGGAGGSVTCNMTTQNPFDGGAIYNPLDSGVSCSASSTSKSGTVIVAAGWNQLGQTSAPGGTGAIYGLPVLAITPGTAFPSTTHCLWTCGDGLCAANQGQQLAESPYNSSFWPSMDGGSSFLWLRGTTLWPSSSGTQPLTFEYSCQ